MKSTGEFSGGSEVVFDHPELGRVTSVGPRGLVLRRAPAPEMPRYSICVMVTNWQQYFECMASYQSHAFDGDNCEVLVLDNTAGNRADAFVALNEFLQAARGDHVILTHQDVTLIDHGRADLDARLEELTELDPNWAICGNAGHTEAGSPVYCLSHPHRDRHIEGGPFPRAVVSLDENFLVVRRLANLSLSRDLAGFHHYAADLCIIADILGWRTYVIDFFLRHHSRGTVDAAYDRSLEAIGRKYARALRPRWIHLVTLRQFFLSGSQAGASWALLMRFMGKAGRRLRRYAGLRS